MSEQLDKLLSVYTDLTKQRNALEERRKQLSLQIKTLMGPNDKIEGREHKAQLRTTRRISIKPETKVEALKRLVVDTSGLCWDHFSVEPKFFKDWCASNNDYKKMFAKEVETKALYVTEV